ncbi:Lrp/AsnC family transcriptional regulator [Shimazuella sp. AN120528]|uniref:Lrp/AsnC family transcriptional regulator n=1 Tax=Shimazuella soli TaxID=1892854 RepID=UPI001F0F2B30|nr:Lrp/AsnC family transcriptional regulator [Shimazuella soli]MCH5586126.1 Lrp/AsnC family transcriptional regulator [Shimazuella soli]
MDQIDAKIITLLQQNARISISQIGRLINMTQPAVGERVRKLEDRGIIKGYQVVLDPEKLGKQIMAYILIQTENCGNLVEFCNQSPEVIEAHQLSGQFNFIIKVMTESMQTLNSFLHTCSKYGFTTTMTVLSSPTDTKALPIEITESN